MFKSLSLKVIVFGFIFTFFSKNLEIVVVAVWLDNPCPAKRIKKIPTNKKITDEIFENTKQEADKKIIT